MIDIDVDEIIKVPCKKKWKKRNKEIYKRYINHETVEELSEAYNLSNSRINEIIRQQSWKDLQKTTHTETGKPNMLVPNIMDLEISAKTRNKLMRLGIMYVKQLKDRLNELEINEVFGDKVMDQLREICHEHGKYVIRINK